MTGAPIATPSRRAPCSWQEARASTLTSASRSPGLATRKRQQSRDKRMSSTSRHATHAAGSITLQNGSHRVGTLTKSFTLHFSWHHTQQPRPPRGARLQALPSGAVPSPQHPVNPSGGYLLYIWLNHTPLFFHSGLPPRRQYHQTQIPPSRHPLNTTPPPPTQLPCSAACTSLSASWRRRKHSSHPCLTWSAPSVKKPPTWRRWSPPPCNATSQSKTPATPMCSRCCSPRTSSLRQFRGGRCSSRRSASGFRTRLWSCGRRCSTQRGPLRRRSGCRRPRSGMPTWRSRRRRGKGHGYAMRWQCSRCACAAPIGDSIGGGGGFFL